MLHLETIAHLYRCLPGENFPDHTGFQHWIVRQYLDLPVRVEFVSYDPYPGMEAMRVDTQATGVLKISALHNRSILDPHVNLMFRAVHDYDHLRYGYGFHANGERMACRAILSRCSDNDAHALLFSEIVAQAYAAQTFGTFEPQKFVRIHSSIRDAVLLNPTSFQFHSRKTTGGHT